ncbi:Peptidase S41 family protein ustP [Fulvia fulva]|uniref:Peptidase S41 family protein ustP n=1 Tax=Passalora fulva TaxID=5499 RepID=A0A9Q8PJZ8_PASFU|nr:Peptidase S41 family protein ustP [Fulvia fulva]KAK4611768.1 Peptidase S41 family protein ustP [Fulvia fulva]KAK4613154.1 Peptidase S41 family protein ustP [Fulvia fulva]UJO23863.1 Peptidase S41 family protein ustP [Fulvia fulva]WPV21176.1 Peptidase S41 family protein ustP [Fulvia fulva]WPV36079.1 Peptidase S41 family protein ustP [Fulvia fulva]
MPRVTQSPQRFVLLTSLTLRISGKSDSVRPFIDWQTNLQWIKQPPPEYAEKIHSPYGFWPEFERIYSKAQNETANSTHTNEYEFGFDLFYAFQRGHDGHFIVVPDSLGIFSYGCTTPLVSVSVDGSCIPEVYVYQDLLDTVVSNATYTPSPLALIDGRNSTEFLLGWSHWGGTQDRDALWNNLFYLLSHVSLGQDGSGRGVFAGGGRARRIYPGPSTTLTFANGTEVTNENFARVLMPFDNITSGTDIYTEFLTPPPDAPWSAEKYATYVESSTTSSASSSTSTSSSSTTISTTIPFPGYPTPFVRHMHNVNSGYFLEDEGYDDIAVLSVPDFVGGDDEDDLPFQAVNSYLTNEAVARNKTKLIIDLSANAGGTVLQGIDLFKQLFPFLEPYQADRFTAHEAVNYIGEEISHLSGLVGNRSLDLDDTVESLVLSFFNYRSDVDINHENFTSWPDKFGPVALGPELKNFTQVTRWNLSDPGLPAYSGGIIVSGYQNHTNFTRTPFKPEDIVIVTDGYCASTCTIFAELMRHQGGVRTIVLGGRPNADIAQAVGGTKGTNSNKWSNIFYFTQIPFEYQYIHNNSFYETTALGRYNDLALYRSVAAVVNARYGFRQGDEEGPPLQFKYEPADCRIYYTPEMAVSMVAVWKTVADSAFRGVNHCVAGSLESKGAGYIGPRDEGTGMKQRVKRGVGEQDHRHRLRTEVREVEIEHVVRREAGKRERKHVVSYRMSRLIGRV